MSGVTVPAVRVEAADAEIAARDEHRKFRRAPRLFGNGRGEWLQRGEPIGRRGFVETATARQRERHALTAVAAEHGRELQRPFAAEQGRVGGGSVAESGETTGGFE